MKRIAVDLARSFYLVAESVHRGQTVQRKGLNRETFPRYIQERAEPVEWVVEVYGAGHDWGGWPGKADRKHLPFMAFLGVDGRETVHSLNPIFHLQLVAIDWLNFSFFSGSRLRPGACLYWLPAFLRAAFVRWFR